MRELASKGGLSQHQLASLIVDNTLMGEDCTIKASQKQQLAEHAEAVIEGRLDDM